jgi:hypothetical protein
MRRHPSISMELVNLQSANAGIAWHMQFTGCQCLNYQRCSATDSLGLRIPVHDDHSATSHICEKCTYTCIVYRWNRIMASFDSHSPQKRWLGILPSLVAVETFNEEYDFSTTKLCYWGKPMAITALVLETEKPKYLSSICLRPPAHSWIRCPSPTSTWQ